MKTQISLLCFLVITIYPVSCIKELNDLLIKVHHKSAAPDALNRLYKRITTSKYRSTPMSTYEKFVSANNYLNEKPEEHFAKRKAPSIKQLQALKRFANKPTYENSFQFRGNSFVHPNLKTFKRSHANLDAFEAFGK